MRFLQSKALLARKYQTLRTIMIPHHFVLEKKEKKNLEILALWISYSFVHLHNKAPKTKVVEERNIVASAHPIPWSLYQHAISTNIHTHAFTLKKKHVHTHTCGCAHAYTKHVYSPIFARTHKNTHNSCFIHISAHADTQPKHTTIPFTIKVPDKKPQKIFNLCNSLWIHSQQKRKPLKGS